MTRKRKAFGGNRGQWWLYIAEPQMPTSPDVYANEATPPLVQGGSNFIWKVTERQRREIVKHQVCVHNSGEKAVAPCPAPPQAVMPLGDWSVIRHQCSSIFQVHAMLFPTYVF